MTSQNRTIPLVLLFFAMVVLLSDQTHRLASLSRRYVESIQNPNAIDLMLVDDDDATQEFEQITIYYNSNSNDKNSSKKMKLPWSLPDLPTVQKSSVEFMAELNELKRSIGIPLPWDTSSPLPTPIFNFNLPKSATLTTKEYFSCGGLTAAHTFVPYHNIRIGNCIRDNFLNGTHPFIGCNRSKKTNNTIEFYSDFGIQAPGICFYSSLHDGGLEHIAKFYPNSTILMSPRDAVSWFKSVEKWGNGRLLSSWIRNCGFADNVKKKNRSEEETWVDFYNSHTEKIRQFAKENLHMTYVEVNIDEKAPSLLESYTGIPSTCLQHCHPGPPKNRTKEFLKTYKKCEPIGSPSR